MKKLREIWLRKTKEKGKQMEIGKPLRVIEAVPVPEPAPVPEPEKEKETV